MQVSFRYFAQVRAAAGVEGERVELAPGADLGSALGELAARHGPDFRGLVLDEAGRVRPSLLVVVNGVPAGRDASRALGDGDEVSLLSAVAGG